MIAKPKLKAVSKAANMKSVGLKSVAAVDPPAARVPINPAKTSKRPFGKRTPDRLQRLQIAIRQVREGRRDSPRTARLLAAGAPKLAQKVVEEAAEVAIEAVRGDRLALINESVDLLYNLAALWTGLDVDLTEIWAEMDRRERTLGMAEKLPKTDEV